MTRALVLLSLLSGCAPLLRNAEPDGFQRSLAELRAKHTPADPKIGTVPVSLSLIDPSYAAVGIPAPDLDEVEQRKVLGFKGLQGESEICFVLFEKLEWNDYGNLRSEEEPKFIASRRARMERGEFYIEAFDSLVDVPTRAVLPASGAGRLTVRNAEMGLDVKYSKRRVYDASGNARTRTTRSTQQEMMYDLCGPVPAITERTRYVTVSQKFKEASVGDNYTHFLYVFALQDADAEPSLDLRGAEGARPVTSTRPPTSMQPTTPDTTAPTKTAEPVKSAGKPRSSQMMSIERSIVSAGTAFTVTFLQAMKAAPGEKFWVTVVPASSDRNAYITYKYLAPDATSIELAAPAVGGDYEVRLHGNYPTKTYNLVDTLRFRATQGDPSKETEPENVALPAAQVDKGASSKMMSAPRAILDPKARFTVKFPKVLKPKKNERYWIAIAKPSAADADYESYQYIDAPGPSLELTAPEAPGEYEVRLHGNYPTKKVNVVDRFKFVVK